MGSNKCFIFTAESQSTQRIIFLLLSAFSAESNKVFIPTGKNFKLCVLCVLSEAGGE